MHRNTWPILIVLGLLFLVTGCGQSNTPVTNTGSPTSSTQSTGTGTSSPVITEFALPTQGGIPYETIGDPLMAPVGLKSQLFILCISCTKRDTSAPAVS